MHVRDDERLAQDLDHRDRRAHRRLEAKLHPALGRSGEELGAAARDELLVRGHNRLARAQELEHVPARRLEPAHHLGDDRDLGVVANLGEVGRGRDVTVALLRRVADERADDAQPVAGGALDVGACSRSSRTTADPTVPYPSRATGTSTDATARP
jgi:hypothetical protein